MGAIIIYKVNINGANIKLKRTDVEAHEMKRGFYSGKKYLGCLPKYSEYCSGVNHGFGNPEKSPWLIKAIGEKNLSDGVYYAEVQHIYFGKGVSAGDNYYGKRIYKEYKGPVNTDMSLIPFRKLTMGELKSLDEVILKGATFKITDLKVAELKRNPSVDAENSIHFTDLKDFSRFDLRLHDGTWVKIHYY